MTARPLSPCLRLVILTVGTVWRQRPMVPQAARRHSLVSPSLVSLSPPLALLPASGLLKMRRLVSALVLAQSSLPLVLFWPCKAWRMLECSFCGQSVLCHSSMHPYQHKTAFNRLNLYPTHFLNLMDVSSQGGRRFERMSLRLDLRLSRWM